MRYFFLLFLFIICLEGYAQTDYPFRVMWYNVENLFDTEDDPEKDDDEFLPSGNRRWTPKRYKHKLQQLAKVITAAGEWQTPALVGLCEVENDSVMMHLLNRTPLKNQYYRYSISKGSDKRGINVALLYQRDRFAWIGEESIFVQYGRAKEKPTRDILHVWGKVITGDTLDVFVCHFPSRSGGEKETEGYRRDACIQLYNVCDSIRTIRQSPYILVMGDLNDTPQDANILEVLKARSPSLSDEYSLLIDLFADPNTFTFSGSHKYQGVWNQLDHILINPRFTDPQSSFRLIPESATLFTPSFLLKKDRTWNGLRPYRTYYGFRYEGGYSDHLPLIVDFSTEDPEI